MLGARIASGSICIYGRVAIQRLEVPWIRHQRYNYQDKVRIFPVTSWGLPCGRGSKSAMGLCALYYSVSHWGAQYSSDSGP